MSSTRPTAAGFTLIELLVVLIIFALVAAVILPSLGGSAPLELKSAARSLASGLRHTRNQALNSNRPSVILIDVLEREFKLPDEQRTRKLPSHIDMLLFTARSEQQSESRGMIRFFPDGSSSGGRITLSADGMRYLVDVDWLTGRISVIQSIVEEAKGR